MKKIITFGEIMLRLSTPNYLRIAQANSFVPYFAGSEANVAVSLARFGQKTIFVSKIPNNDIGDRVINELKKMDVDTSFIVRGGERLGIFFSETGVSFRPSKVIYDRKNSSISNANIKDFDFDHLFESADWFHFSGITPALSKKCAELIFSVLNIAKKNGVTISCDLNYRKALWTEKEAQANMIKLMPYVDVCIGNEEDAEKCLGFRATNVDVNKGSIDGKEYQKLCEQLKSKFGFKIIAFSLRDSYSASDNGWSGIIYDGINFHISKKYDVRIVDRIGTGDAFAAGLIHYLANNQKIEDAIEFAVAASALKHTISGDFNLISEDEVISLLGGNSTGRVIR